MLSLLALGLCLIANMPISKAFAGKCYNRAVAGPATLHVTMKDAKKMARTLWRDEVKYQFKYQWNKWKCAKNKQYLVDKRYVNPPGTWYLSVRAMAKPCKC